MTISEAREGEAMTLFIDGRVDTTTSPELQNRILLVFQKVGNLILDFSKCEYVSSAGLRALLIGQKTAKSKGGSMKLINVPEALMQILKVTGFDKILTIE